MEAKEQITRWRLILGQESDKRLSGMGDGDMSLSHEQDLMDQALASIYNRTEFGGFGGQNNPGRGAAGPPPIRRSAAGSAMCGHCLIRSW